MTQRKIIKLKWKAEDELNTTFVRTFSENRGDIVNLLINYRAAVRKYNGENNISENIYTKKRSILGRNDCFGLTDFY